MNRREVMLSQVYTPTWPFCVFGEVFVALFILKCWNQDRLWMQTFMWTIDGVVIDDVNKWLIEKWPEIVNRKGCILQHHNARAHSTTRTLEIVEDELVW